MDFGNLTEGQRSRARACKTPEQILALAQEGGYELSEQEPEAVSGGVSWSTCSQDNNTGPY